ncbi:hypothetical protein [Thermogemmatispora carboxidivorans]|uniref:hypothetical protein n=1 Tax=Thermogemmatispora carboxidivorans TaxID=1382306 RepID=UPI001EE2C249|nr:hypothetical protein [Thermogemmatispora carboxidivorans]
MQQRTRRIAMQMIACREEARIARKLTHDREHIKHYTLHGVLPEGYVLALNTAFGTLSCLTYLDKQPALVLQQQFTNNEMNVLRPLLDSYPYYCPYEVLFAHFYHGEVTERTIERCRANLLKALEDGTWEQATRPIRNVLSRVRIKLRIFGINIVSILETGYILKAAPAPVSSTVA